MTGSVTQRDQLHIRRIAPAYQQVADQLRALILGGDLSPGERLPNEAELSAMFGVSRSTVREALRVLSSQNLLTTSRGVRGGSFIARPEPGHVSDFLEVSLSLLSGADTVSVADLLEARELLEVPAARLAAERHRDDELDALRAALDSEREGLSRGSDFEEHRRFHQAVLQAAGNSLLEIMTEPVFGVLRTRFLRKAAPPAFWEMVADDHDCIFARIAKRDADGAAEAMRTHLQRLATTYERIDRTRPR